MTEQPTQPPLSDRLETVAVWVCITVIAIICAGMMWLGGLVMRAESASRGPDGVIGSGDEGPYKE